MEFLTFLFLFYSELESSTTDAELSTTTSIASVSKLSSVFVLFELENMINPIITIKKNKAIFWIKFKPLDFLVIIVGGAVFLMGGGVAFKILANSVTLLASTQSGKPSHQTSVFLVIPFAFNSSIENGPML